LGPLVESQTRRNHNGAEITRLLSAPQGLFGQPLRSKVDAAISEKVSARRRELETQLSDLARHNPRGTRTSARGRVALRPVAPKYRNPKDPSQTWAARGLQPLWLKGALKSGRRLESFLIDKSAKARS
jgi:DNA-binding protein H-NS